MSLYSWKQRNLFRSMSQGQVSTLTERFAQAIAADAGRTPTITVTAYTSPIEYSTYNDEMTEAVLEMEKRDKWLFSTTDPKSVSRYMWNRARYIEAFIRTGEETTWGRIAFSGHGAIFHVGKEQAKGNVKHLTYKK